MMSFIRSVIFTYVSSTHSPTSPVCSQPSASMVRAVASGFFQYPAKVPGCLVRISPVVSSMRQLDAVMRLAHRAELHPAGRLAVAIAVFLGHPVHLVHRYPDTMRTATLLARSGRRPNVAWRTLRTPIRSCRAR